jgi:hypothetical protein
LENLGQNESFVEVGIFKVDTFVPARGPLGTTSVSGSKLIFDAVAIGDINLTFLGLDRESGDTGDGGGDECGEEFSGDLRR